ncbi:unnamed protein product [Discula destructiva]
MGWLEVATEALAFAYFSLLWIFLTTIYIAIKFLQFVALPVAFLWRVLLFLLAPVIYAVRFVVSPLIMITNNIPRLAPVYIYFASAIFIGLLFGLLLVLTTSTTFSLLSLNETNDPSSSPAAVTTTTTTTTTTTAKKQPPEDTGSPYDTHSRNTSDGQLEDLDALLAGISSSPDSDHLIAALQGDGGGGGSRWRDPANTKRKRRAVGGGGGSGEGGLFMSRRFGTILEEDDDSL